MDPKGKQHGLSFDGTNLWNTDDQSLKIYKLDTSGTVFDSFDVPGYQTTQFSDSTGLTWDGMYLWNADFSLVVEFTRWTLPEM